MDPRFSLHFFKSNDPSTRKNTTFFNFQCVIKSFSGVSNVLKFGSIARKHAHMCSAIQNLCDIVDSKSPWRSLVHDGSGVLDGEVHAIVILSHPTTPHPSHLIIYNFWIWYSFLTCCYLISYLMIFFNIYALPGMTRHLERLCRVRPRYVCLLIMSSKIGTCRLSPCPEPRGERW